ncbi:MAG TPA: protein kinase family protein [Pseudonocardiaceae bacterium]|nr:protein kinase family protein [Pseudonocardiaceae bacterium]
MAVPLGVLRWGQGCVTNNAGGPVSGDSTGAAGTPRPVPPWPTPGALVGRGRYRLLSEVGRDDRGNVRLWQGRDLVLDRDVALTLFIATSQDPGLIRSAVARALRSARLETAGAARVLDVLEPDARTSPNVAVVVAEWTRGRGLIELLNNGLPPPSVAAGVLAPLAGAVDAAHSAGLILGCDHPYRIRVTPDGQARLAFPGPLPETSSQDDIRGLGAMLYLLLTGYWPLLGGPSNLPTAPRQPDGSPASPTTLRPGVPVELSTLTLRSLADPGTGGGVHTGAAVRRVLELSASQFHDDLTATGRHSRARPADPVRAHRQRRTKLGLSMAVLVTTTLLILGYAGMQVLSVFVDTGGTPLVVAGPSPDTLLAPVAPPVTPSAAVRVKNSAVYDPSGLGSPDHQKDVGKLLDGNPNTGWSTDSYLEQFPSYKKGLGVMLSFEAPVSAASVTVISPSPGTVLEIRTATSPKAALGETTLVGTATLGRGSTQIPLRTGPPTRYLLVWITGLAGAGDRNQSKLSEVGVQTRAT